VLNRLRLADVYLDSFPFSGVNSLLDPLDVGLPPVVMEGNSFRSLMAPSLMRELNEPELIAADEAGYLAQAVRLAYDASLRAAVSARIKAAMAARPRFVDSEWYSGEVDRLLSPILAERGIWTR
jgi:predicted O-linked N-acetylglucosamine transferase (SPINDLY family)